MPKFPEYCKKRQSANKDEQYATSHVRKGELQNIHVSTYLYRKDKPENEIGDGVGGLGWKDGEGVLLLSKPLYSFDFLKYINIPHIKLKLHQQR